MTVDSITNKWIRTKSDEAAVAAGCRFNERRAAHVVEFFHRFLRHSKGEFADKPFDLLDWQRDDLIYPIFGWEQPDGRRRIKSCYCQIPKKNGKSTIASAIGLYMLIGDNEPGAEIYSAATQQEQASIVHGEAIKMVEASPALSAIIQLNRSTKAMSFPARKSIYRAISSEAHGQEGLNAHAIIIDELHAWQGDKLWNTLQYAFAARRQPLRFVITTAGDDPLSVCYKEYEYATRILAGEEIDVRHHCYIRDAAPTDDWTEPAVWLKANPSMGDGDAYPLKVDDFAADVAKAKATPTTQATFKRYRLNVWQTAAHPWLDMTHWRACTDSFDESELIGRDCFGGLDLAKTRDTTAFVLVFPWGEDEYRLLPYFWLPEGAVTSGNAPQDFRRWAESGQLTLTPGNVCDYAFVEQRILELSNQFSIRGFAYDPYNAEQVTQRLDELHGIPRTVFKQTINNYAEPTREFERLVISGKLRHNGHPLLTWQIGNTSVRTDPSGNIRPVKPEQEDNRKIDGVVAGVMALALAMADNTIRTSPIIF